MWPVGGTSHRAQSLLEFAIAIAGLDFGTLAHAGPLDDTGAGQLASRQSGIPSYVIEYAPLVWLQSQELYLPSDIGAQVANTIPEVNSTAVEGVPDPLCLDNLDQLNALGGTNVYLTSKEGIRAIPDWFKGVKPDSSGKTDGAVSSAIVVTDHQNGTVDAFYFYFYAYNQGNTVVGLEFGDHVGDWEHNMIRFANGEPQAVWYSQHSTGQAFTYDATEKKGKRPYTYSAKGTHANYAVTGTHDHAIPYLNLPVGFVEDHTDEGVLWDPTLSAYTYSYDSASAQFTAYDSYSPVNWLYFDGLWGDAQLPDDAEGQIDIFGQRKYVGGPNGPKFKDLNRTDVCPSGQELCIVWPFLHV